MPAIDSQLVSDAARAVELFGEDELERFADFKGTLERLLGKALDAAEKAPTMTSTLRFARFAEAVRQALKALENGA